MNNDLLLTGKNILGKEAAALASFVDKLDGRFIQACEVLFSCQGTVLLTGIGKSGLVARKWASTLSSTGTKAYFVNPAEARHGDLGIIHPRDVLIILSYSGETSELSEVVRFAKESGITTIGVTGNRASSLAKQCEIVLLVEVDIEACPLGLAPTTSTTLMMALGDSLALTLMQMRGFTERDFARLHPGGSLGRRLWLRVEELMHSGSAIPIVAPHQSLNELLVEMTQKCLGLAIVMDQGKICGVITDGDLRRFFQKKQDTQHTVIASDLMSRNPKVISARSLAVEAREMMERSSIHQLLIVDDKGSLVGVVHLHDLLRAKVL